MESQNDLYEHEFLIEVHNNIKPSLEKFSDFQFEYDDDSDRLFRVKNPPKLNRREYYHWDVFQLLANVLKSIDRSNEIQVYIDRFPSPRTYERKGITQDIWIKYHYGNYISTMVTINDTSLLLVNQVFQLGLDPRDCRERTVAKNSKVAHTETGNSLVELKKLTEKYRYPRNILQHRGEQPDIGILQVPEAFSLLQRSGDPWMDVDKLDELYSLARSAITADLQMGTQEVVEVLSQFLDSLIAPYDLQSRVFVIEEEMSGQS